MILYYSATGNSAFAAKRIANALHDECRDLLPLVRKANRAAIGSKTPWIVVAPTFAYQLPRFLADFLRQTPLNGSQKIYFVLTCGAGTGGAAAHLQTLCKEINKEFCGCGVVLMPENYLPMFPIPSEEKSREIVQKAIPVIDGIAEDIKAGKMLCGSSTKFFARIGSSIINNGFFTAVIKDRKFRVDTARCSGCGKCLRNCPMNNLTRGENGTTVWNGNCTHCMACICGCPNAAIEYGNATKNKRRYHCPE